MNIEKSLQKSWIKFQIVFFAEKNHSVISAFCGPPKELESHIKYILLKLVAGNPCNCALPIIQLTWRFSIIFIFSNEVLVYWLNFLHQNLYRQLFICEEFDAQKIRKLCSVQNFAAQNLPKKSEINCFSTKIIGRLSFIVFSIGNFLFSKDFFEF